MNFSVDTSSGLSLRMSQGRGCALLSSYQMRCAPKLSISRSELTNRNVQSECLRRQQSIERIFVFSGKTARPKRVLRMNTEELKTSQLHQGNEVSFERTRFFQLPNTHLRGDLPSRSSRNQPPVLAIGNDIRAWGVSRWPPCLPRSRCSYPAVQSLLLAAFPQLPLFLRQRIEEETLRKIEIEMGQKAQWLSLLLIDRLELRYRGLFSAGSDNHFLPRARLLMS